MSCGNVGDRTCECDAKAILIWEEVMPTLVGFGTFAALREEQISEKVSRRILSGDQGMIVWWSIGVGVHVEPHSHPNSQIVWMLKGSMELGLGRTAGLRPRRRRGHSGGYGARGTVPRRHRGDRFLRASARGLPTRGQTCLHERRLNSSLACSICSTGSAAERLGHANI